MVGTLFDVGRGRYPKGSVQEIFAENFKGERTMAPPQGLVLEDVIYGERLLSQPFFISLNFEMQGKEFFQ